MNTERFIVYVETDDRCKDVAKDVGTRFFDVLIFLNRQKNYF